MKKILVYVFGTFVFLVGCLASIGPSCNLAGSSGPAPSNSATLQERHLGRLFLPALLVTGAILGLAFLLQAVAAHAGFLGAVALFLALNAAASQLSGAFSGRLGPTLTSPQVLQDVLGAFRKWFPGLGLIGTDLRASPLKLNQRYIAHIATLPTAGTYDSTNGYAGSSPNSIRGLLTDVEVVTNQQPICPLKWLHLDQIKDIKQKWDECMSLAGYVIAKAAADTGIFAKCSSRYFSNEKVITVANFDYDALLELGTEMNSKGCLPTGRVLFINSAVAQVLAADSRMISKDFAGQLLDGNGYRQWRNVGGFALIQEYPDLPALNGTALTSVTAEADDDLITKAAHGLETGDPFVLTAATGATGLTVGNRYWAIKVSSSTFKAASSYANAMAGTGIDITLDGSAMTITPTHNMIAFAADKRAFSFLAGLPDGMANDYAAALGIPKTVAFDSIVDKESGMPMAAAKWQVAGTADFYWVPTFVYGTNAGKQGATALPTNTEAANSILAAAQAAGSACDYAGLRVSSGAT